MTVTKKHTSISALEQAPTNQPIWALNGAPSSEVGQPGEIHVGIPKINGSSKIDDLHLPQTWLAINLTDQIPRVQLLASSEFRNAVNNKLIVLITPEYAEHIGAQTGADEERARLVQAKRAVREAVGTRTIQQSGADVVSTSEIEDATTRVVAKAELSPSFVMFVAALASKSDIEALNAVRGRGKLNMRELNHISKELTGKAQTQTFVRERKDAIKASRLKKQQDNS